LTQLAIRKSSQTLIRLVMKKVREQLKVIHEEFGFFGGINLEYIYYD